MAITSNVKQTIALTGDGSAQKYVGASATTITKARIMSVTGQASAADASIKIYNEADSSKTAAALVFEAKWATAANETQTFTVPGEGIYCNAGMYVDLNNCDYCTIIGTFT